MNELQDFEYLKFQNNKENLHDVFGTVLDTFQHITGATVTGQIYLWEVFQRIKFNLAFDIAPDTYLLHKYVNGERSVSYDKRKEQLPSICYNARFNGYKDTDHLKSITNLMFLDIDDFPTREMAMEYKQKIITKYDWIVACNLSLSKIGLHVIALVDNIYNDRDYTEKYNFISHTYFDKRLDKGSNKLTQYTVVPYDYNIYINESPSVLNIDKIINEHKKGIRSGNIQTTKLSNSSIDEKGISSAYITDKKSSLGMSEEKGIPSIHKEEEIICTSYTFFSNSHLNNLMNDVARERKLKFKQEVDESHFHDPNIPIYIPEGIDTMEVNLRPLNGRKILEGNRHNFIGALTLKMIYLNAGSPDNNDAVIRRDILKFILHINKTICSPPLTYNEILKSYNSNWKKYKTEGIDFSRYFNKQRAFWSQQSTLTSNEKRSVTCKIKNAPIVEETKRRIWEAIEELNAKGKKITQSQVALVSGLAVITVKKYRKEYREYKNMLNPKSDILEIYGNVENIPEETNCATTIETILTSNNLNQNIENEYFELVDSEKIEFEENNAIRVFNSNWFGPLLIGLFYRRLNIHKSFALNLS